MPLRNLVWLLVVPGIVGLGLAIGYSAPAPDKDYRLVRQIVEVLAEVDANYVRELTDDERQKLVENMINGGLSELDKHSQYFNEQQLHEFETENKGGFGGVGILFQIDPKTKIPKVEYPMAGTPAYDAGVVAGDLIVKVDGVSTENMASAELRGRITGETGTKVTLTLQREGHNPPEFPVALTRAEIPLHPVSGFSRRTDDPTRWNWFVDPENKIGLIRIAAFNELTAKEVEAAVKEIEGAGGRGLIIDLRDNPGGLLTQAIEVSDLFLTEGKIVSTKDRHGGTKTYSARESGTLFLQKPIAVLVNNLSASASEIVAAALQDNKRAAIVGERTYGKGSVQTLFRLAPDQKTAVKLTTQTYWRPSGKNMDKLGVDPQKPDEWGVSPDEGLTVVSTPLERLRYGVEMQKLKYVAGKPDVVGPNPPPAPPINPKGQDGKLLLDESKPFDDRPMTRALEYLRKKLLGVGAAPLVNPFPQLIPA
ncbi:MAG TPA: S41 family peptidase [Gemmata sp.]|jgi:carboxyl-terminal processing protease|nr:S41 family peptidase [Gemmata sp.]